MPERDEFDGLRGWGLGDAVPSDLLVELRDVGEVPATWSDDDPVFVLSHECDLAHRTLEGEPHAELIRGRFDPTPQERGNASFGKNPRRFAIPVEHRGDQRWALFDIAQLQLVPRGRFVGHAPSAHVNIEREHRLRLAEWRSRRYVRRALPDEFERRLRASGAPAAIRTAMEEHGERLSMLLIAITHEELQYGEEYDIEVVAVMRHEDFEDPDARTRAQIAVDRTEAELNECPGIVCQAFLVPETRVTLDDLRAYQHWDFLDHLSRRGGEVAEPPV